VSIFQDMTPEEQNPQNREIVVFLRQVSRGARHVPVEEQAQALARMRTRLLLDEPYARENASQSQLPGQRAGRTRQERTRPVITLLPRKTAAWKRRLSMLIAVVCVALLVGTLLTVERLAHQRSAASPSSSAGGHGNITVVTVHMGVEFFTQSTASIKKGTSIRLVNDEPAVVHVIFNGYWKDNHPVYVVARGRPVPQQVLRNLHGTPSAVLEYVNGQGMPGVEIVFQGDHQEQVIGPFTTAGTYSFFDTIHVDMNLMVIVR
jgi:plastocyanin